MIEFNQTGKFKRRQRHAIYKKALEFLTNTENLSCGLCWALNAATNGSYRILESKCGEMFSYVRITKHFPEIIKRKPANAKIFWFSDTFIGKQKRINILNEVIKETAPNQKKVDKLLGCCEECFCLIFKSNSLFEVAPNIYECPECGRLHSKEDIIPFNVGKNPIGVKVYNFKTKYRQGFLTEEICKLLKENFPKITYETFADKLGVVTCMAILGKTIIYHRDVALAIKLCIEKRDVTSFEFD